MSTIIILSFQFLSFVAIGVALVKLASDIRKQNAELLEMYGLEEYTDLSDEEFSEKTETLEVSEHISVREAAFDERIARMQKEIERTGTTADILHPSIENLPHDEVPLGQYEPPEEVSI